MAAATGGFMVRSPLVGRTLEDPDTELFYWLEGWSDEYIEVSRPGDGRKRYVGRPSDFRRYGDALAAAVNPTLALLSLEERHTVRGRLIGAADRRWDTYGVAEHRRAKSNGR
jgi:hypothetical protein